MQKTSNSIGMAAAAWAVTGFSFLILFAVFRLSKIAFDSLSFGLDWYHWLALGLSVLIMAYSEGYRGFQQKFSPRFAARCYHLSRNPKALHVLLAPLFCMGFFHTTRARKIATFALTLMILCFVQIAHLLPHPWRGILDLGVVTGLIWGLASLYIQLFKAFGSSEFDHSPELPD